MDNAHGWSQLHSRIFSATGHRRRRGRRRKICALYRRHSLSSVHFSAGGARDLGSAHKGLPSCFSSDRVFSRIHPRHAVGRSHLDLFPRRRGPGLGGVSWHSFMVYWLSSHQNQQKPLLASYFELSRSVFRWRQGSIDWRGGNGNQTG